MREDQKIGKNSPVTPVNKVHDAASCLSCIVMGKEQGESLEGIRHGFEEGVSVIAINAVGDFAVHVIADLRN
jgi:hypothetical protein